MNVCVIGGAGYVGLITGLGLAEIGHTVVNVDVDRARIDQLTAGNSPVREDGIQAVLERNLDSRHLRFSDDLQAGVKASEIVFVAVGTPSGEDGQPDLSQIIQVAEELSLCINSYKVIVIKSTVPVGTVDLVTGLLTREKVEGQDFDIVTNPEFLREGKGLFDFFCPDRIVIGADSQRARQIIHDLYEPIVHGEVTWHQDGQIHHSSNPVPVVDTDPASAQMIKYASNAFLAARISFINEIAGLSTKMGADVKEVELGMGYDPRIGHAYLEAGLGFGGPCLEKDLRALLKLAEGNGYDPQLLKAVLERNEKQIGEVIAKVKQQVGDILYKKVISVYGLAFKAGTNDVRNSLAVKVIERLEQEGAIVRAHDPVAIPDAQALKPRITYCQDPYDTVVGADALLILTEWASFQDLDYSVIMERMASPSIIDARNLLDIEAVRSLGFNYVGIGRP